MRPHHFRVWLAFFLSCVAITGTEAEAIDPGACCVQSTSRLESQLNPNKGSDETFFTAASGPPNIMLLLDTSCSMNNWPEAWPSAQGCNHPGFAGDGYDPTIDYRGFINKVSGTPLEDPDWFDDAKVYEVDRSNYGHDLSNSGAPTGTNWTSHDSACAAATGLAIGSATHTACKTCLATKGYYVGSNEKIGTGNYLEFYAPRDVGALMVLSQLIYDVREIRLGIMTFDSWGSNACWNVTTTTSSSTNKSSCTTNGVQRCHDLSNDPNNCGACGNVCPAGQVCDSSTCVTPGCPNGMALCGGQCVDLDDNPAHCGTCGNACGGSVRRRCGSSSDGQCSSGHSGCGSGRTECPPGSGICVRTNDDPNNCGGCGVPLTGINICGAGQFCNSGSCTALPTCPFGLSAWTQADGGVACADRESNPEFCGPGGVTCGAAQECDNDNNGQCEALTCTTATTNGKVCLWEPQNPSCDKMYPFDSSSVESNRASILNNLAKDNAFTMSTPLATILYAAGYHLRSRTPDGFAVFGPGYPGDTSAIHSRLDEPNTANNKSICTACGFNAAILLTDGSPNNEMLGTLPSQITSLTTVTNAACPAGTGFCNSYLDEVAAWLWLNDIRADLPGKQSMATYTIGFATNTDTNQLLRSTAIAGGGRYYAATGSAAVKEALLNILDDINTRNNSFSSAATVAVQTGSNSAPALLPRMQPKSGQPWEGRLWRFEQYNEFVETTGTTIADLNGDGDNDDIFIVDSVSPTIGNVVTEAADGTFVRNNTAVPATPFWEANAKLVSDIGVNNWNVRNIWTVVDVNGDGAFTSADAPLVSVRPGTAAADLKMAEYMGLVGSPFCPSATGPGQILQRFGMGIATAETAVGFTLPAIALEADYARLCARVVMRWAQGADFFDIDGDGIRDEVRPSVLGDIFHSSPIVVEAPIEGYLCELGLSNQCARTLYSQSLGVPATPLGTETTTLAGPGTCVNAAKTSYEAYVWDQRRRDKVVLVGSNDGMIHAFLSGRYNNTESCTGGVPIPSFTKGTGQELWAFIPPDLLPKLPDLIIKHEYMVDGDIMVRDIWADTATPFGSKTKAEFHTIAVVAEGRGGKHYFALEMQYNSDGTAADRPGFRWMFPQPCSEEAATFGKTLFALSPKAPPIGPVLIDNTQLPTAIANPIVRYGVDTHERWVVALSGGWSPALEKGRGVYMVDAWEGQINGRRDNLWWKFEFNESASGSDEPAREMSHSVSAPVALVDYGNDTAPTQDGFFDTAVFGDTGGQLWVARLHDPGRFSSTNDSFRINNWFAARAFEMDRYGAAGSGTNTTLPDGGVELADPNAKGVANKAPFFYLPSVAIQAGTERMRVFAGSGNRYAILEERAGSCRFDNPLACSKALCDDVKIESKYKDGVVDIGKMETHWKARRFEHGKLDKTILKNPDEVLAFTDMCGVNGGKVVETENNSFKTGTCTMALGPNVDPGDINLAKYECGLSATGSSFTCTKLSETRKLTNLLVPDNVDNTGLGNNRFVGIWAYGGLQADGGYRGFSGTSGFSPDDFDDSRLTDRASSQLVDVTGVGCNAQGACDGGASEDGYGWYLDYGALARKTATGGSVIASCVLWSDLAPSGGDGGTCGATVTPTSAIYQADFLTGQPNCAFSFLPPDGGAYARSQSRTVVAPPPEPASVVQVSKAGEIRYSAMIVEPGKGQATTVNVSGGQDVLQMVYELPVSRSLHNCRHADAGCTLVP